MADILPQLTFQGAIETTKIHIVAGMLRNARGCCACGPFVHHTTPDHTIYDAGMVGGGLGSRRR